MSEQAGDLFFTKKRLLWRASALRLLRESRCAQYARCAMPDLVDGIRIELPETHVSVGLEVTVRSRRIEGDALFELLYRPESAQSVVNLGMAALKALHSVHTAPVALSLFGRTYQAFRELKAAVAEVFGSSLLLHKERRELMRLIMAYNRDNGERSVLVHGDLHPSHLIVGPDGRSLAFIDLEAMRMGKAATNFAQLWIGYYIADPMLGRCLYERYVGCHPDPVDARFDADARAEIALRCHRHVREGRRSRNRILEERAGTLLSRALSGMSIEKVCCGG